MSSDWPSLTCRSSALSSGLTVTGPDVAVGLTGSTVAGAAGRDLSRVTGEPPTRAVPVPGRGGWIGVPSVPCSIIRCGTAMSAWPQCAAGPARSRYVTRPGITAALERATAAERNVRLLTLQQLLQYQPCHYLDQRGNNLRLPLIKPPNVRPGEAQIRPPELV